MDVGLHQTDNMFRILNMQLHKKRDSCQRLVDASAQLIVVNALVVMRRKKNIKVIYKKKSVLLHPFVAKKKPNFNHKTKLEKKNNRTNR